MYYFVTLVILCCRSPHVEMMCCNQIKSQESALILKKIARENLLLVILFEIFSICALEYLMFACLLIFIFDHI